MTISLQKLLSALALGVGIGTEVIYATKADLLVVFTLFICNLANLGIIFFDGKERGND